MNNDMSFVETVTLPPLDGTWGLRNFSSALMLAQLPAPGKGGSTLPHFRAGAYGRAEPF